MQSFVLRTTSDGVALGVDDVTSVDEGDVTVDLLHSALNFKDHLVAMPRSRVRRRDTLIMGVEAAGIVESSRSPHFHSGDLVIVYGGDFGVGRDGGFTQRISVPPSMVTVLDPDTFTSRSAMIWGIAGYTAMASVIALEEHGLEQHSGSVLVTGATGGVGSLAVRLLRQRGYHVTAVTGSPQHEQWLRQIGAQDVIGRSEIGDRPERTLGSERWGGAIDCVGGDTLTQIIRTLRYGAAVAASGLVGGNELGGTVYPFITRGVSLLGIDAVDTPAERRRHVWDEIGHSVVNDDDLVERTIPLSSVAEGIATIGRGDTRGRWLVDLSTQ